VSGVLLPPRFRFCNRLDRLQSTKTVAETSRTPRTLFRRPERAEEDPPAPQSPGEVLRAARLRRRISLSEAEQGTRIRQRYLQALEDDDYTILPAGVYSLGFLRNYAIYLGVPPEDVLSGFSDRRRRNRRVGVQSISTPIDVSVPRSAWLLLAGGLIAVVLITLAWLGLSEPESPASAARGNAAVGNAVVVTPTALVSLPPLAPAATAVVAPAVQTTVAPTATASGLPRQLEVELKTVDRAWVRATVDGRLALEETLAAGETRRWTGQQSVLLRVGNGAGVDVTVNGQRIGALGPAGQPVDREFTR
jgi:cytoskeleton protein RodZ